MYQSSNLKSLEDGRRESDVRPKVRMSIPAKKKGMYMDDALSKTGFGFFNYLLIIVAGLILFAVMLETCGVMYIIPIAQCDLQMSASQKGVLAAIGFFGVICSSLLWGYLADTVGRRAVIYPTVFIAFLLSLVSSFIGNFYLFIFLRFLNGFFVSGGSGAIYAYIGEFHNDNQRGRVIMGTSVLYGASCIFLPLLAGSVINLDFRYDIPLIGITYTPWRLMFVVSSIPSLFVFLLLSFMPESPKFVLGQGKQKEAYKILRKIYDFNHFDETELEEFEIYEESESIENRQQILKCKSSRFPLLTCIWNQISSVFKGQYMYSTILICGTQFVAYATANGFFMLFAEISERMNANLDSFTSQRALMCDTINNKLHNITHSVDSQVCINKLEIETLEQGISIEILYTVFLVIIGIIVNKVGLFPILFVSLIVPGTCGLFCMFTDIPILQIIAFIGLMECCVAPNVINAATVEIYPTSSRAMAVCISLMFGRLGCVVGANVAAILLDNHCETVFYLSSLSLIGASFLAFLISKVHKNLAMPDHIPVGPRISVMSLR